MSRRPLRRHVVRGIVVLLGTLALGTTVPAALAYDAGSTSYQVERGNITSCGGDSSSTNYKVEGGACGEAFLLGASHPLEPTLIAPSDGVWLNATHTLMPTLTAAYKADGWGTGTVTFEICRSNPADPWSANCAVGYNTGDSAPGLADGASGAWAPMSNLTEGVAYWWRARGTNTYGIPGAFTSPRWFQIDVTAPTKPANVVTSQKGQGSVRISWDASTDSGGSDGVTYDVEATTDGTAWTAVAGCTDLVTTTCTKGGLGGSQLVVMRVRASDAAGNSSSWSNLAEATNTAYYLRSTAACPTSCSSLLTSGNNRRAMNADPVPLSNTLVTFANSDDQWYAFSPAQNNSIASAAGQPNANPEAVDGTGWIIDDFAGKVALAGSIQITVRTTGGQNNGVGNLYCRAWKVTTSGGNITSSSALNTPSNNVQALNGSGSPEDVITAGSFTQTCDLTGLASQTTFGANDGVYVELWLHVVTGAPGGGRTVTLTTEDATSFIAMSAAGRAPDVPSLVSPADGTVTNTAPTLTASYSHPDAVNGLLQYEVSTNSGFTNIVETGSAAVVASGNDPYNVAMTLTPGTTYWWRARGVDVSGRTSAWTSTLTTVIANSAPNTPTNALPLDAATTDGQPTLTASAFSDPNAGHTLNAAQWQVRTSAGSWADPVVDVTNAATSHAIGSPLGDGGYVWRVRYQDNLGTWSAWSATTTFTAVNSTITITIPSGSSETFTSVLAASNSNVTSTINVDTNAPTGYSLSVTGESDDYGMKSVANDEIELWGTDPTTPTAWPQATSGAFGMSVLSATDGKDTARWGSGTTVTDYATLKYIGPELTTAGLLHSRPTATTGNDAIEVVYRVNPAANVPAGDYGSTVQFTAVMNP